MVNYTFSAQVFTNFSTNYRKSQFAGCNFFQFWVVLVSGSNVNDLWRTKGVEEPALVFQVLTNFIPQTVENSCQAFKKTQFKKILNYKNTDKNFKLKERKQQI